MFCFMMCEIKTIMYVLYLTYNVISNNMVIKRGDEVAKKKL